MPLSGQSLPYQVVTASEFRHILDWTRHPIRRRSAKKARVSQPVRVGEQKRDPRCKQSVTAAVLQEQPWRRPGQRPRKAARWLPTGAAFWIDGIWRGRGLAQREGKLCLASARSDAGASRSCWRSRTPDDAELQRTREHGEAGPLGGGGTEGIAALFRVAARPRPPVPHRSEARRKKLRQLAYVFGCVP